MRILTLRSDEVYRTILASPSEARPDMFRQGLMAPFAGKWACYGLKLDGPVAAAMEAARLGGCLVPPDLDERAGPWVQSLADEALWARCLEAVRGALAWFEGAGVALPVAEYHFTLLLADAGNPSVAMSGGCLGDGGIPGYITALLVPHAAAMLVATLAHEVNHNVRFQFQPWRQDITLGDMLVAEGLAERFAVAFHGVDSAGPWVRGVDEAAVRRVIAPRMAGVLAVSGMAAIAPWLYGDETARAMGLDAVGVPYCAGYACGYHLIGHYLKKTGTDIRRATTLDTREILREAGDFFG